jgi:adenine-specific DNA-methyltransferase
MPRKKASPGSEAKGRVDALRHTATRANNPPAGLEGAGSIAPLPPLRHEYNPHLSPALRTSDDPLKTDRLPELLETACQRALTEEEARLLAEALRRHEPWLEWSGKREAPWFVTDPVALHIHERVSTQAILKVLAREDVQRDLFADPQQSYAQAVQFYQHEVDWANRLILGDSLQVMASLARRENLAGKVQMIYLDPPYGISFKSNFQPSLGQRDVKDRVQDLTREPEMVKAYRDTWTLGIHSYLAYLRDRLILARELLAETGSIFVQISDENLHRVRLVMDEVFRTENYVASIQFQKTTSATNTYIPIVSDTLLWYAKDATKTKYRPVYNEKQPSGEGADHYRNVFLPSGERRQYENGERLPKGADLFTADNLTSASIGRDKGEGAACWFPVSVDGKEFTPNEKNRWKTNEEGMRRLIGAERVMAQENTHRYLRRLSDFSAYAQHSLWTDVGGAPDRVYIVQTNNRVIERCLLMTTDPGDLVLDPTCGSGTTAFVAEQWGRRWITCDTSRVALARQRLLTAKYAMYKLRPLSAEDLERNPKGAWLPAPSPSQGEGRDGGSPPTSRFTFQCKTVSHITLKSIARNSSLDPIFARHEPILAAHLAELNAALAKVTPELRRTLATKLLEKQKKEGKRAISEADRRRWQLPDSAWREWEVPYDTDPDWPAPLARALAAYRAAWRAKMDEVNRCIEANAPLEELVDKPDPVGGVVRVAGPFTVEGVIAREEGPDSPIGGAPDGELETFAGAAGLGAAVNAEAHLHKMLRLLKASGVDFPGNHNQRFLGLEPLSEAGLLHAEGEWSTDGGTRRVAVSIGPAVGNLSAWQVEEVVRQASRRGHDELVFAAFGFDAAAQDAIEQAQHPHLRLHMALIRPDVAMDDLLKTQPGSQIFTVFSAPRVKAPERQGDGQFVLEVEGMDVYDPVGNTLHPTSRERIAAWFLDGDYDGRTFCISQAFFPDHTKWDRLAKALGDVGAVEQSAFAALRGFRSLPVPRPARHKPGERWRVAVKVIDPRGNEGLRVVEMPDEGARP